MDDKTMIITGYQETPEPLVKDNFDFEAIVKNPILKPIAEADRSIQDMDKMLWKNLTDSTRLKDEINLMLEEVQEYGDVQFFQLLMKYIDRIESIVKIQDIKDKTMRRVIKEMHQIVITTYGIRKEFDYASKPPVTILAKSVKFDYYEYLKKIKEETKDENVKLVTKALIGVYDKEGHDKTSEKAFKTLNVDLYKKEDTTKEMKTIISSIMKREI